MLDGMTNIKASDVLKELKDYTEDLPPYSPDEVVEALEMAIKALEQDAKTGYWIDTGSGQKCSECGEIQYGYDNFRCFCANCGAKMVEPQKREEEE